MMSKITNITANRILDSRGEWTLRTRVCLDDETVGIGEVPSGISTGKEEAALLPVEEAIKNVNERIAPKMKGLNVEKQEEIDRTLIDLDGTENKSNLGANAILSVSLAVCDAAAKTQNVPLYKYISAMFSNSERKVSRSGFVMPKPMLLMFEGEKHGSSQLDFQEFMIVVTSEDTCQKSLEFGVSLYHTLALMLRQRSYSATVGAEGGFSPQKINIIQAFDFLDEVIDNSGKKGVKIALDVAANSFSLGKVYKLSGLGQTKSSEELLTFYQDLKNQFPALFLLEDPFTETDLEGWKGICEKLKGLRIAADDLTVTKPKKLESLIDKRLFNTVIIKPNQIGTLSETLEFSRIAKENGFELVVSHRAGETNSSFISDLAVGIGAEYAKFGAPARGERAAKYNRLLEIEREIESST